MHCFIPQAFPWQCEHDLSTSDRVKKAQAWIENAVKKQLWMRSFFTHTHTSARNTANLWSDLTWHDLTLRGMIHKNKSKTHLNGWCVVGNYPDFLFPNTSSELEARFLPALMVEGNQVERKKHNTFSEYELWIWLRHEVPELKYVRCALRSIATAAAAGHSTPTAAHSTPTNLTLTLTLTTLTMTSCHYPTAVRRSLWSFVRLLAVAAAAGHDCCLGWWGPWLRPLADWHKSKLICACPVMTTNNILLLPG